MPEPHATPDWSGSAGTRLALCCALVAAMSCAPGSPTEVPVNAPLHDSYQSFLAAADVLDASIRAHGGVQQELSAHYTGQYHDEGHYREPYRIKSYAMDGNCVLSPGSGRAIDRQRVDGEDSAVLCRNGGALRSGEAAPTQGADAAAACREAWAMLPQGVLALAQQRRATLHWLGNGRLGDEAVEAIGFADRDGQLLTLVIGRKSRLLLRVEQLVAQPQRGDSVAWIAYSDYRRHGSAMVPARRREQRFEVSSSALLEIRLRYASPAAAADGAMFEVPGLDAANWPSKADAANTTTVGIAPGVFAVELPAQNCRVPFVPFDDHVVVIDPPLSSSLGERVLAAVNAHSGGKPISFVLVSHHHPHHLGGVRPFIHAGATIVTTHGNERLLRDYADRPHRIEPDRLSLEPRALKLLLIKDHDVLEDAHHRLEIYDIAANSNHTSEYLIFFLPATGIVISGDLVSFPEAAPNRPASARAAGLYRALKVLKLDVRALVNTWPLADQMRLAPYERLHELVEGHQEGETP